MLVKPTDTVEAGDRLTTGSLNLQDQLKFTAAATARHIMNEIQFLFMLLNGDEVSAKHLVWLSVRCSVMSWLTNQVTLTS